MYHPLPVLSPATQSWQATGNPQKLFGLAGTDETGRRATQRVLFGSVARQIASLAANDKKTISGPDVIVKRRNGWFLVVEKRGAFFLKNPSRKC